MLGNQTTLYTMYTMKHQINKLLSIVGNNYFFELYIWGYSCDTFACYFPMKVIALI